jgi:error-prone DNA polymerase
VLVRQRPGTASGILFITLEDETGVANIVVFNKLFEQYRKEILRARLLMVEGKVQIEGEVIHVIAQRCMDLSGLFAQSDLKEKMSRADEKDGEQLSPDRDKRLKNKNGSGDVFHEGRNFR